MNKDKGRKDKLSPASDKTPTEQANIEMDKVFYGEQDAGVLEPEYAGDTLRENSVGWVNKGQS